MLRTFVHTGLIVIALGLPVTNARATDVYQFTTLNAPVFSQDSSLQSVAVTGGMTVQNVNVYVRDGGGDPYGLSFDGTQSVGGTGTLAFNGGSDLFGSSIYSRSGTFTLGAGITVSTNLNAGLVGGYIDRGNYTQHNENAWINHGTLWANGKTLTLLGHWQNDGVLKATGNASLILNGFYSTADLININAADGYLTLGGQIDNTSHTLDLSNFASKDGTVRVETARIGSGTLVNSAGRIVQFSNNTQLDHVTIGGNLAFQDNGVQADSLTLANGATLQPGTRLTLGFGAAGTQTISGSGQILLNNATLAGNNATVKTDFGVSVRGTGTINATAGIVNYGSIIADGGTLLINTTNPSANWESIGQIYVRNNGTLVLGGQMTGQGLGGWNTSGGVLDLVGTINNTGHILSLFEPDQSFTLGGTLRGGRVQQIDGGQLTLSSYNGSTATLDGTQLQGNVVLGGSTTASLINGVSVWSGYRFLASGAGSTLTFDSTVTGEIALQDNSKTAGTQLGGSGTLTNIGSGLTIRTSGGNGQIGVAGGIIDNRGLIDLPGNTITTSGTFTNRGTVSIAGGSFRVSSLDNTAGTLSLSSGTLQLSGIVEPAKLAGVSRSGGNVTLAGTFNNAGSSADLAAAVGSFSLVNGAWINGGTVVSSSAGQPLQVLSGRATIADCAIAGDLNVASGATLSLNGNWSNTATISANNATIVFGGTRTTASSGSFNTSGTLFQISAMLNNSGAKFPDFAAPGGTFSFVGAVNGGTLDGTATPMYLGSAGIATFDSVTIVGSATLNTGGSYIKNSLTLVDAQLNTATNSSATFVGTATLGGSGTVVLNNNHLFTPYYLNSSLTLGSGILVRSGAGTAVLGADSETGPSALIVNGGTISAQTAGQYLRVYSTLNNQGTVQAINGATLALSATPANLAPGTFTGGTLNGGTWYIGGNSTISLATGAINTNNATIVFDGNGGTFGGLVMGNNTGTFILSGGSKFTNRPLTNNGLIRIDKTSVLKVGDNISNNPLSNSGTVQLDGGLIVDYAYLSPLAIIKPQINTSIISSEPGQTIGYATGFELNSAPFMGVNIDTNVIALRSTFAGDDNLDGKVDIVDLGLLAGHWQATSADWYQGDYNYDGKVDIVDLGLLAGHWQGTVPLATAMAELNFTAVPEPTMLGLLVLSGWTLRRRRNA